VAAHPIIVVGVGDQAHSHPVRPQVNIGRVIVHTWHLADRRDESRTQRERSGSKVRAGSIADHTPILDARGLVELLRANLVVHAGLHSAGRHRETLVQLHEAG
jgi:hypothetical protein